ncbi:MAG: hypothetical protein F2927_03550 [Actinobacteria bacterium]|uniref:Unannotated protein n=1 Tax=freshwater metagenome TaxID=449393 RepID=A0A6J7MFL7_9ZZZZ|nr:hypothetical protein [Actinomycetota bacterium]MTB15833.1 hypothetical protein [Actinomycetota bacterium]
MKVDSKKTFLDFDKNSKDIYDLLGKKFAGIGKAPANVDLFVFAMAYGFHNGNKVDAIQKSGTGVRVEYIKPEHELLMSAIQFAETGSAESLLDQEQRFLIAERYAEGGIRLLKDAAEQPGDFLQDISGQMSILFKNLDFEN